MCFFAKCSLPFDRIPSFGCQGVTFVPETADSRTCLHEAGRTKQFCTSSERPQIRFQRHGGTGLPLKNSVFCQHTAHLNRRRYRDQGMKASRGVAEGDCWQIDLRLKRSGTRWSKDSANGLLALETSEVKRPGGRLPRLADKSNHRRIMLTCQDTLRMEFSVAVRVQSGLS